MDNALVVVRGTETTKDLVREAGALASGIDATLYLLHVTTEEEFADRADALASIPEVDADYGVEKAISGARQFADDVGHEVLGSDVPFTPLGRIGDRRTEILDVANEHDCDHIFIHGDARSPAGKAVFGDLAQSVILNFDGPVTVVTE